MCYPSPLPPHNACVCACMHACMHAHTHNVVVGSYKVKLQVILAMTKIYNVSKWTSKILWGKEKTKQEPTIKKLINTDWSTLYTQ